MKNFRTSTNAMVTIPHSIKWARWSQSQ